jgi:hypothetical protein
MAQLGSVFWRLRNYGVIESLQYFLFKTLKSRNKLSTENIIESFELLVKELDFEASEELFEDYRIVFERVSKIYEDFVLAGNKIKGGLIGSNASQTRFKVIAAIISKYKFDVIIEAGTQHGASALFTKKFLNQKNKECKLFSIDVSKYQAPREVETINRIILDPPVRKNFKEQTQALITGEKSVLYFHDSDHSYENMVFEFDWAWNHLKSKVIIADDVENNSAFYEFVNYEKAFSILCKFDSGPAVGIAIRT